MEHSKMSKETSSKSASLLNWTSSPVCAKTNSMSREYLCSQLCVVLNNAEHSVSSPDDILGGAYLLTFNLRLRSSPFLKQLNKSQRQKNWIKQTNERRIHFPRSYLNCTVIICRSSFDPSRREDMALYANNVHHTVHDSVLSTGIISSEI